MRVRIPKRCARELGLIADTTKSATARAVIHDVMARRGWDLRRTAVDQMRQARELAILADREQEEMRRDPSTGYRAYPAHAGGSPHSEQK